jgi:mRNA interferase YafQ
MQEDVFASQLSTHSLKGKLLGLKACSCGYDCRILFTLEIDETTTEEVIVLLDIGNHDEVY